MTKLSDDEYEIIKSFIGSSAYQILKKIAAYHRSETTQKILAADNPVEIYRLQGQCRDIAFFERLSDILVEMNQRAREDRLEQEHLKKINDPRLVLPQHQSFAKPVDTGKKP